MAHKNKYNLVERTYVAPAKVANQNQAPVNLSAELVEALGFNRYAKGRL